jgi:uncharacterized protein with HEPN domain
MDDTRDAGIVLDLIQAAEKILTFTANKDKAVFIDDVQLISAVSFQIAILGEAVKRLSAQLQSAHSEIPWRKIAGMRDRLIHGYNDIDVDELWNTAIRDVPTLLAQLRRIHAEPYL